MLSKMAWLAEETALETFKRLSNQSTKAFTVCRVADDSIRTASWSKGTDFTDCSLIFKASYAFAKAKVVLLSLRNRLQHLIEQHIRIRNIQFHPREKNCRTTNFKKICCFYQKVEKCWISLTSFTKFWNRKIIWALNSN